MPKKIYKYILGKFITSFLIGVAVFTALLMMDQMSRQIDQMANNFQNLQQFLVSFLVLTPPLLSYSIPLAFLMAMISTLDQMKQDNELTAIFSTGISPISLFWPFAGISFIVFASVLFVNTVLSPASFSAYNRHITEISGSAFLKGLRPGTFFKGIPGTVLLVGDYGGSTGELQGVLIVEGRSEREDDLVLARRGTISTPEQSEGSSVVLELNSGSIHPVSAPFPGYRSAVYQTLVTGFEDDSPRRILTGYYKLMAAGQTELLEMKAQAQERGDTRKKYEIMLEMHRRLSFPVTMIIYPLIVFPFAIAWRKHGKAAAFGSSIILFVMGMLFFSIGSNLVFTESLSPGAGAWLQVTILLPVAAAVFLPFLVRQSGTGRFRPLGAGR